jgi:DNA-binding IclR family transcriptional regulator
LKEVVDAGYAVNKGGFFPGIGTVARSIRDARGRPVAALSVDFPTTPETESLWHDLPKELGEATDNLEALIRAMPDSPDL